MRESLEMWVWRVRIGQRRRQGLARGGLGDSGHPADGPPRVEGAEHVADSHSGIGRSLRPMIP